MLAIYRSFQIGTASGCLFPFDFQRFADLEIRDTADLEVGATGNIQDAAAKAEISNGGRFAPVEFVHDLPDGVGMFGRAAAAGADDLGAGGQQFRHAARHFGWSLFINGNSFFHLRQERRRINPLDLYCDRGIRCAAPIDPCSDSLLLLCRNNLGNNLSRQEGERRSGDHAWIQTGHGKEVMKNKEIMNHA